MVSGTPPTNWPLRHIVGLTKPLLGSPSLRFFLVLILAPAYLFLRAVLVLSRAIFQSPKLLTKAGRASLLRGCELYREDEDTLCEQQLQGAYRFNPDSVVPGRGLWLQDIHWPIHREYLSVCGLNVSVAVAKPISRNGHKVLLLHGNPTWGYLWRDVVKYLLQSGHEVFLLDFIGHGASDKPTDVRSITFELHMRTLQTCLQEVEDLHGCYIAAHDWGGCVALCTLPHLPPGTCKGLMLVNSFFPPRMSDVLIDQYLLFLVWYFSTGIFDGLIPDGLLMRLMTKRNLSPEAASAYSAPFPTLASKANIYRFAHMVPGLPNSFYNVRQLGLWKLLEGWLGPWQFSSFNAQARLSRRGTAAREWWEMENSGGIRVGVVFGQDDSLLGGFKETLEMVLGVEGIWLPNAGHYPMEDQPEALAERINDWVGSTDSDVLVDWKRDE